MRRAPWLLLGVGLAGLVLIVRWQGHGSARALSAPACVGNLETNVYASTGLVSGDFSSLTAVDFPEGPSRGAARLNTNLLPLDTNNITLPFEQRVRVKYVYRNAGAQHSLGWFYLDGMGAKGDANSFLNAAGGLADLDGNGLYDWFEGNASGLRQRTGLWRRNGAGAVRLLQDPPADGGSWGSVPNAIESLMTAGGGWIFKICDDDGSTGKTYSWMIQDDVVGANDGIPDYDVNGDGIAGNEADRTVDLGILSGNRELVLFMLTYHGQNLPKAGLGGTGSGDETTQVTPLFSKYDLNPDLASKTANATLRKLAIGCARDDAACYGAKGGDLGWMDSSAISRLDTATYNHLSLTGDATVKTIKATPLGQVPHFVVTAPASDPNRWIIGMEDLAGGGDLDWNDVVVVVEKSNGGEAISNEIAKLADNGSDSDGETMISKIRINATFGFPLPGCAAPVTSAVKIFYSVDNKTTWREVTFPASTGGEAVVDVLGKGDVGSTLHWKVQLTSSSDLCQPTVESFSLGWEAIKHGQYKYSAPIPNGNVLFSGSVETPAKTWTVTHDDFSLRGHLTATRLYDPANLAQDGTLQLWDAGAVLSSRSPDTRVIFTTSASGAKLPFTTASSATLYPLLLDGATRGEMLNGQKVFDFDGDGDSDDGDAQLLLQWVRGWELGTAGTLRAWKLGPVHYSSAAIVGPPANPAWYEGSGAPASLKTLYNTFRNANKTRRSLAVVGAEDGMVHAFDAGAFRFGQATDCVVKLERGCYAEGSGGGPDYGDGSEQWAFIPPSQLDNLKSNPPKARNFLPETYADAEVDGGISAEDLEIGGAFYTGLFVSGGRNQPYLSALRLPSGSTVAEPMWSADFMDADFKGTDFSPAVALAELAPGAARFIAVVSSGLGQVASTPYLYVLDAATGVPVPGGKTRLTQPTGDPDTLGIAGYPNLVDANGNGLVDRVYTVDTSGRVFKLDLTTMARCQVAALGETVFAGMATEASRGTGTPKVHLYVGGSPNPDGTSPPAAGTRYHLAALEDEDPVGSCTTNGASLLYTKSLAPSEKLWATPYVAGSNALFASSGAESLGICAVGSGTLYGYDTGKASVDALPIATVASATLLGSPVSSIRIFDAHVFVNTVGGKTVQIGASGWNNINSSAPAAGVAALQTLLWQEY